MIQFDGSSVRGPNKVNGVIVGINGRGLVLGDLLFEYFIGLCGGGRAPFRELLCSVGVVSIYEDSPFTSLFLTSSWHSPMTDSTFLAVLGGFRQRAFFVSKRIIYSSASIDAITTLEIYISCVMFMAAINWILFADPNALAAVN